MYVFSEGILSLSGLVDLLMTMLCFLCACASCVFMGFKYTARIYSEDVLRVKCVIVNVRMESFRLSCTRRFVGRFPHHLQKSYIGRE